VPGVYSDQPGAWTIRHYDTVLQSPVFWRSLTNSLVLAGAAGLITILIGLTVAYIVHRTTFPLRKLLDYLAWVPWTVPGLVMGLGLLWAYIYLPDPFNFYGTIWLVVVAFVTTGLPLGVRLLGAGVVQVDPSLEQIGWAHGAGRLATLRLIILPLLGPAMFAGFIILFAGFIRALSTVVLLYSQGSEVLSAILFDYYLNGKLGAACAVSTFLVVIIVPLLALARRLGGFGVREIK
jgi:iron(III) transport system permease protein